MDYIKLGQSELNVSRICLGCMGFGDNTIGQHSWTVGEDDTRMIIRKALEQGINLGEATLDTEGLQTMRTLANNMTYMLKQFASGTA